MKMRETKNNEKKRERKTYNSTEQNSLKLNIINKLPLLGY